MKIKRKTRDNFGMGMQKKKKKHSIFTKLFIKLGIAILKLFYEMMKDLPVKNRVLIMSRQANEPTLDIRMLVGELDRRNIKSVVICKKLEPGFWGKLKYFPSLHKQMRYLATSKVVVLDSYNIPVSVLPHREETKVIQMWHALGSMKKFGKSILDMPEGSSSSIAEVMKMHEGYDYIFTSSKESRAAFAEAFGYPEDKLTVMSLPRVDAILNPNRNKEKAEMIMKRYPELTAKKTILYAPTIHQGEDVTDRIDRVIYTADTNEYNLIIKLHPLTEYKADDYYPINVVVDTEFETIDMLSVADFVITDYSAITYEAALKGLPIYFYAYDLDYYIEDRSFYLDYEKEMPGPIFMRIGDVIDEIESGKSISSYKMRANQFANKYIEKRSNCTEAIGKFIEELL